MDETATLSDCKKHIAYLKAKRQQMDALWPIITKLIFSVLPDLSNNKTPTLAINHELYDGSGGQALKIWGAGVVSGVATRDSDWAHLRFLIKSMNTLPGIPDFQMDVEDVLYGLLDQSTFYEWAYDFAQSAGWSGTAAGYPEPDPVTKTVTFLELKPGSFWIDENKSGVVDTLYREFNMQAQDILKNWSNLPEAFRTQLTNDPYCEFPLAHLVRPRKEFYPGDPGNRNFKFQSLYFAQDGKVLLEESGYKKFPFLVFRVSKIHGTPWGGGPGLDMIRDGQIAQAVAETMLLVDQKLATPPMKAPDAMSEEDIDQSPDALNFWPTEYLDKVAPLFTGNNRPVGMDREAILRQTLERHFGVDKFLSLTQNQAAQKTATETVGIQAETTAILTPWYAGFTSQVVDPMFELLLDIAQEFKVLPPVPESLKTGDAGPMKMVYTGPAATMRKRYRALSGVKALSESVMELKNAYPDRATEISDNSDLDKLMALAHEGANLQSALVDEDTREKNRKMRRQALALQAQQAAQAQAMQQVAAMPGQGGQG